MDLYKILGINKGASGKDIRRAFKKKSKESHPDANLDNVEKATEEFTEVSLAYSVLSDDAKRDRYDNGLDPNLNPDVEAMNFAAHTFRGILLSNIDGLNHIDVIDKCTAEIDSKIEEGKDSNRKNVLHKRAIEAFSKRLQKKKKSKGIIKHPVLEEVMENTLRDIDKNILLNEETISMLEKCKEILSSYSDSPEDIHSTDTALPWPVNTHFLKLTRLGRRI